MGLIKVTEKVELFVGKICSINDFFEDITLIRLKNIQHKCFRTFVLKMKSEKQLLAFPRKSIPQKINSVLALSTICNCYVDPGTDWGMIKLFVSLLHCPEFVTVIF